MNMNDETKFYCNEGKTLTKEELLEWYRGFLGDKMEIVHGIPPPGFIEIAVKHMESRDPVKFFDDFNRWASEQGWRPCAGSITEADAGTLAVGEVNS